MYKFVYVLGLGPWASKYWVHHRSLTYSVILRTWNIWLDHGIRQEIIFNLKQKSTEISYLVLPYIILIYLITGSCFIITVIVISHMAKSADSASSEFSNEISLQSTLEIFIHFSNDIFVVFARIGRNFSNGFRQYCWSTVLCVDCV